MDGASLRRAREPEPDREAREPEQLSERVDHGARDPPRLQIKDAGDIVLHECDLDLENDRERSTDGEEPCPALKNHC